jgi:hypothetical protein
MGGILKHTQRSFVVETKGRRALSKPDRPSTVDDAFSVAVRTASLEMRAMETAESAELTKATAAISPARPAGRILPSLPENSVGEQPEESGEARQPEEEGRVVA